jgi:primosomal protein N' (replication factor Y)
MNNVLVNIAIPSTVRRLFTYRLPPQLIGRLKSGQRCIVPFGRRKMLGYFIDYTDKQPRARIRDVINILEPDSLFNNEMFSFLKWMSKYYYAPFGDVFNTALPPSLRRIKMPDYELAPDSNNTLVSLRLPNGGFK